MKNEKKGMMNDKIDADLPVDEQVLLYHASRKAYRAYRNHDGITCEMWRYVMSTCTVHANLMMRARPLFQTWWKPFRNRRIKRELDQHFATIVAVYNVTLECDPYEENPQPVDNHLIL
jgi:hypothetical protein